MAIVICLLLWPIYTTFLTHPKQAISRLHGITGSKLYTVDTGSRSVLFHPKLYFVQGKALARLIIGSANLTLGGLNNNVEASVLVELDLTDPKDKTLVDDIKAQFLALPADYPENIIKISTSSEIDALFDAGRLVDEMAVPPPRPATSGGVIDENDPVPLIKLKVKPLRRALARARAAVPKTATIGKKVSSGKKGAVSIVPATVGVEFDLVWESKPLTRRDLNIPDGDGTNPTGSPSLDKGLLPKEVDHRHYFREEVFSALAWSPSGGTVDEAFARFQLVVKGISYGEFDLRIAHSTSTTSKAYRQRNAMTRLSWGLMKQYIAHPNLIGRTLALYRDRADQTRFVLEID